MSSILGLTLRTKHTTMKVRRVDNKSTKPLFLTEPYVSSRLVIGDMKKLVAKPKFVDQNEWLAANTYDFFHHVNVFFGTVAEYCTNSSCRTMCAGDAFEYFWVEGDKKPIKVSAPEYIDYSFSAIVAKVDDERVFPTKSGADFPKNFDEIIRTTFKRLFRVLAHIYHSHFDRIVAMQEETHLNTLFIHFVLFAQEFDLLEKKEFQPMQEFIDELSKLASSSDNPVNQTITSAGQ